LRPEYTFGVTEPAVVHPGDSWVVSFPDMEREQGTVLERMIHRWAEAEGLRRPLVLFGATVAVIARE
jgi:hypothetical protein